MPDLPTPRGERSGVGKGRRLLLAGFALAVLGAGAASALQDDPIGQLNVAAVYAPTCEGYPAYPSPPQQLPRTCLRRPKRVKITIRSLPERRVVQTIVTQRDGLGRAYLPPGDYEVRPQRWHRLLRVDVRRVTVVDGAPTDVIAIYRPPPRVGIEGD